jgi:hypothetical protein
MTTAAPTYDMPAFGPSFWGSIDSEQGARPFAGKLTKGGYLPKLPSIRAREQVQDATTAATPQVQIPPALAPSADTYSDKALAARSLSPAISRRIHELMKFALEDGERLPSIASIKGMSAFARAVAADKAMKDPLLTTDDVGLLIATWRISTEEMLSLKFLDEAQIEFAWALKDASGKLTREWGATAWTDFVRSFHYAPTFFDGGESRLSQKSLTLTT